MRSTGEVMGIDTDFSKAYAKAALAAGQKLPTSGTVFISVADKQKEAIAPIAKQLEVQLLSDAMCNDNERITSHHITSHQSGQPSQRPLHIS